MRNRLATLAGAVGIMAVGLVLYMRTADNFTACASTIGGIVRALDPASARDCANVNAEHDGGIAIMILGAVVLLLGLMRGKKSA